MSDLPVLADPEHPALDCSSRPRDPWSNFRTYLGKLHTLVDRRVFWASPDRELVGLEGLRKGEVRARRRFWRMTRRGMPATEAVWQCLGLDAGPIPEFQDQAAFDASWTTQRVTEVAQRWLTSKLTMRCAAAPVTTAISKLEEAGPDFADTLITIARDPKAKDTDRRQAARDGLQLLGVKLEKPSAIITSPILLTGAETAEQLEGMLLQIAQKEPDPNRARLLAETIRAMLKAKKPEMWGDKLEVTGNGQLGLGMVLAEMAQVRKELLEAEPPRQVIEVQTSKPDPDEGAA